MSAKKLLKLTLLAALLAPPAFAQEAALRVCADPDNLPFMKDDPVRRGLYLDFAERLAEAMGRTLRIEWWRDFYAKRMLRATLLADRCDAFFGLPHGVELFGPRVIYSKPLLQVSYALALPAGVEVGSLADLRGRKVAVQFGSPPQNLLAVTEGVTTATFLTAEEAMQALADGTVDAAHVWGPSAGFYNKEKLGGRFRLVPTSGEALSFDVAIGFSREDAALRDEVDRALDALRPALAELTRAYGFPEGEPTRLAAAPADQTATETAAQAGQPAVAGTTAQAAAEPPGDGQAAAQPAAGAAGSSLFNSTCSHCHGPNGQAAERRVDLRRLRKKYGDRMDEVFHKTVREGRPAKGMPSWKESLDDAQIAAIKGYIDTLQKP